MKRQAVDSGKVLANRVSNKTLVFRICKSQSLTVKKSKESIQMAYKHMKRFPTSIAIRELQIKITMRNHYSLIGTAERKRDAGEEGNVTILNADNIMENQIFHTFLIHCWWNTKLYIHLWGKKLGSFKRKHKFDTQSCILPLGIYPREMKIMSTQ